MENHTHTHTSASMCHNAVFFPETVYCWGSQFFLKRCPALSRWWCPAFRMSPICLPVWQLICLPGGVRLSGCLPIHLSLSLVHGVRLFGCLPIHLSPLFGWWCLALRMSPNGNSFVSQCGQCCSALWMYHFYLFPFICLPAWLVSGSLDVSLHLSPFICLPLCLVVSGSSDVFSLFHWSLIRYLSPCVSQFICLPNVSQLICLESAVCLSGGVRLYRLFTFVCLPSFVPHHLSLTSSVSEVICLQSYVCLSGGVRF